MLGYVDVTSRVKIVDIPSKPFTKIALDLKVVGPDYDVPFVLVVVDYTTRYVVLTPLMNKTAAKVAEVLYEEVILVFGAPEMMVTDGGTEFYNSTLRKYCSENGIQFQLSNTERQAENGKAEVFHKILMRRVRPTMASSPVPIRFWPECYKYMAMIENYIPKRRLHGKSAYECLYKRKPHISDIQVWGSLCWAHIPEKNRKDKTHRLSATGLTAVGCI